jgi:signal peptidase I
MSIYQWFCVFPICTNSSLLGTWKLYEAAGENVGLSNSSLQRYCIDEKIMDAYHLDVVAFIPIINLIMFPVIWIETGVLEKI